ncbi:MATH and LRR domain-containing protein PFE0570w-like [Pieris rapae]|uniref:MATH and LRR domain-containing protein PFE0570w-like n=1 Tax=Pieris rapae TaxID=64459 RepID=UPI001E27A542|nr:MATH and LRR domain-containing protein PFE0570w-like [Pieris rapae]
MSHCDYDTIFYRVFCATVLGIAFTFTVILTNVFIDIDGLLSKKDTVTESTSNFESYRTEDVKNDVQYDDGSDDADPYRGKRSIEPDNFLFQVKNPNIKKMLTNKLANLLEELDEEESTKTNGNVRQPKEDTENIDNNQKDKNTEQNNDNMLHLAMHNILLQGIIGHMDLNNVYKKVHLLVKNFYEHNTEAPKNAIKTSKEIPEYTKQNEEEKFFEELLKCKTLKNQVNDIKNNSQQINTQKEPKVVIKTVIEINDKGKLQRDNSSHNNDIIGLIKLIYNGKSIKIEKLEDSYVKSGNDNDGQMTSNAQKSNKKSTYFTGIPPIPEKQLSDPNWNKIIENYLKQYPVGKDFVKNIENKINRKKRQIKIHYLDSKHATDKPKTAEKIKKDDEELYIEIETHFDGKGIKGEKKKKLVRSLIDKIQKAIHDDGHTTTHKKSMSNHIKIMKRNQDPIKMKNDFFLSKIVPAIRDIEHRQLDPINNIISPIYDNFNYNSDRIWNSKVVSPKVYSRPPLDAVEMGNFLVNYNNKISKRDQKPITIEENRFKNTDNDLNNVTFYLKDIDGSGFSVGFNQYVDEPPDMESLKLFNGVENLIQEYHNTYDNSNKVDKVSVNVNNEKVEKYIEREQESISNSHVFRRSVNNDPNLNYSYKKFIKKLIKPLNYYKPWKFNGKSSNRIFRNRKYKTSRSPGTINVVSKPIKINDLSVAFINNYYNEIPKKYKVDSLENTLKRRKRSVSVKKISNLNSKIKLNRFININPKFTKKTFKPSKRNKRELNKIRIIARERSKGKKSNEENVILLSPSDVYSKTKGNIPETDASDTQNSDTVPFSEFLNLNYPNQPLIDEYRNEPQTLSMPQYPHIFFEEQTSREYSREDISVKPYRIQAKPNVRQLTNQPSEVITERSSAVFSNVKLPGVEEIVNAILPPKSNYKVTVKISPKNTSGIHNGFKEVHTSVNKSYDRNGFRYFSLLNVSQFSKVENVNESNIMPENRRNIPFTPVNNELKEKEKQIQTLFQFHKKRIDSQLDNLKQEKTFIENILHKKEIYEDTTIETNENFRDPDNIINVIRKIEKPRTTTPKTFCTVTQAVQTKERKQPVDQEKKILISTIQNNEQTTKEILKKIDINTDLLRQFLHKLTLQTISSTTEHFARVYEVNNYYHQKDLRNSSENKPISLPQNHYAEEMVKHKFSTQKPDFQIRNNQSRFFIDDLEDYNSVSATIKINTTRL